LESVDYSQVTKMLRKGKGRVALMACWAYGGLSCNLVICGEGQRAGGGVSRKIQVPRAGIPERGGKKTKKKNLGQEITRSRK